jgi:hypothetical protein
MLANLRKLIRPTAEALVTVEITRNCSVGGTPYSAGDRPTVSHKIAAELVNAGAALDSAAEDAEATRQRNLAALIPPPGEAKSMPESWATLPSIFADWWNLDQQGMTLIDRAEAIERLAIEKISRFAAAPDFSGVNRIQDPAQRSALISAAAGALHVGELPPGYLAECQYLRDASERANEAVSAWRAQHGQTVAVLRFKASQAVLDAHGDLARTAREIQFTGRSIFAVRIGSLGLAECRVDDLFRGSADFQRYVLPAEIPALQELRVAWFLAGGTDQASYLDRPVPVLAQLWQDFTNRSAELVKLLKTGQAELAKAQKAIAA